MRVTSRGGMLFVVGCIALASTVFLSTAQATTITEKHHGTPTNGHGGVAEHDTLKHSLSKSGKAHYARSGGGLQCVTFARAASGIALKGNAANWWDAAAGVYQRGSEPEPGSVLNFRANGHMRLGHVAVVTQVLSSREIEIDHANWAWSKGNVTRGIRVVDVSAKNDWSAVRVGLGHGEDFGSVYPTYGFIYDRPDSGTMIANTATARPALTDRPTLAVDEVAEAPAAADVSVPTILPVDAPDRGFR